MFVSCSWDDGIEDHKVIGVLRKLGITKATFFPCIWGELPKPYARQLYAGFEIGNHTRTHQRAVDMAVIDLLADLKFMENVLERVLGVTPVGMAFPYGAMTEELHKLVIGQGYLYTRGVNRSLTNLDYVGPDADYGHPSFWNVYRHAKTSFVFYGHAAQVNEAVLEADLKKMLEDGCVFVTHAELVERRKLL